VGLAHLAAGLGVVVSLCGLLALLRGRFDPGSGWEVRGAAAVALGVLALPALPLVLLINPSLSQRAAWTAEAEEWKQGSRERQERKEAIAERVKQIDGRLAELDKEKEAGPGAALRQLPERRELQRESLALAKERLALTQEEGRVHDRLGSVGRGRPRDPMPYLLPLGWGAALYGLGWLFGRKKPTAEKTGSAEPAAPPAATNEVIQSGPHQDTGTS